MDEVLALLLAIPLVIILFAAATKAVFWAVDEVKTYIWSWKRDQ